MVEPCSYCKRGSLGMWGKMSLLQLVEISYCSSPKLLHPNTSPRYVKCHKITYVFFGIKHCKCSKCMVILMDFPFFLHDSALFGLVSYVPGSKLPLFPYDRG